MRECGDRIRRERASPTSPRLVLRRVLVLSEGRQFREAAAVLQKLGANSIAAVAGELPLDLLVEGLPHSAQLLETFFNKDVIGILVNKHIMTAVIHEGDVCDTSRRLAASGQRPNVNAEQVVWQLVRLFASYDDPTLKTKVARLAKSLFEYQPDLRKAVTSKKKALEQAVQGLGCHGLTPDESGLTHLHVALKTELQRHIESYKSALHRLDELRLAAADNKKPVDASHQRLLSLRLSEVQQRLIENKTLLTILDKPALKQLDPLIETLAVRVQNDKEALFCISQLKRLQPVGEDKPVATVLMCFSRGCGSLLELMQMPESPCNSDTGYHSETEAEQEVGLNKISAGLGELVVDQGFVSLHDVICLDGIMRARDGARKRVKVVFKIVELVVAVVETLEHIYSKVMCMPGPTICCKQKKRFWILLRMILQRVLEKLHVRKDGIGRYEALYYHCRPRALEALDALPDLKHATQLKSKILFSVVVLAFRTCKHLRDAKLRETFRSLHLDLRSSAAQTLRQEILRCLSTSSETFPLSDAESQVTALVCDTLREYRCLGGCSALRRYVGEATRVAWFLVNQFPAYELDTDFQISARLYPNKHQRHQSSDTSSEIIRAYLWPALMLQNNCVFKAVVVTGGT
ncbi:hypothetical protein NQ317_013867 [Molorchus minor]|uniref:Mitochondria-eating protein n=1 Tax=Molorchus minor TaxID=1323400 RepID=A0ABQ9K5X2_9CUCU|nr:hypothetical protein NQ317_013867 [Molorchus minor]